MKATVYVKNTQTFTFGNYLEQVGRYRTSGNPERYHRELDNLAGRLLTQEWTKTCFLHVPKHNVVNSFSNMIQFSVKLIFFFVFPGIKKTLLMHGVGCYIYI